MNPALATQTGAAPPEHSISLLDQITDEQVERDSKRFELIQRKAELARMSKCYPDVVTMEVGAIKMMMADTLAIDPMVALTDIRVYEGKPEISAGLTAALLQRAGYSWQFIQHDELACRAAFFLNGQPLLDNAGHPVVHGFTMEEAERAGYTKRGLSKDTQQNNYHKVPKNMLYARMITNFCKWFAPWVTRGMTIYAPGEIETAQAEAAPAGAFVEPTRVAAEPAKEQAQ